MGFMVGMQEEKKAGKEIWGKYQKVAVGCWFTAAGRGIPKILKYEDDTGERHIIKDIHILRSEQKFYAGILSWRYDCQVILDGAAKEFTLLYHPGDNTWDMALRE